MMTIDERKMMRELKIAQKRVQKVSKAMDGAKSKELLKSNREIGKTYIKAAKSNIKNYHEDTVVKKRGKEYPVVRGQLKASMGSWRPSRKHMGVVTGPRANAPMKRKVRPQADGWFAHMVEERPKAFGPANPETLKKRKRPPQNRGVFKRSMKQSVPKMRQQQLELYRKILKDAAR